jgi:hypothetical protein
MLAGHDVVEAGRLDRVRGFRYRRPRSHYQAELQRCAHPVDNASQGMFGRLVGGPKPPKSRFGLAAIDQSKV